MTLPPWISQQYSDIQYSDPYRQPKEPDPPRHINAYQVLKKMGWSDFQQIHQAQAIGFPKAFAFETKKVGGGASRIGIYMEDKIDRRLARTHGRADQRHAEVRSRWVVPVPHS